MRFSTSRRSTAVTADRSTSNCARISSCYRSRDAESANGMVGGIEGHSSSDYN
jgi:hypothetical protein